MSKNAKNIIKNTKNNVKTVNNTKEIQENYFYSEDEDRLIVSSVLEDFERRRMMRKPYDLAWELNINFMLGNQFSYIS